MGTLILVSITVLPVSVHNAITTRFYIEKLKIESQEVRTECQYLVSLFHMR